MECIDEIDKEFICLIKGKYHLSLKNNYRNKKNIKFI